MVNVKFKQFVTILKR